MGFKHAKRNNRSIRKRPVEAEPVQEHWTVQTASQAESFPAAIPESAKTVNGSASKIQRKVYNPRKGGIGFSTKQSSRPTHESFPDDIRNPKNDPFSTMSNRFTVHTGQKVDVNSHMYVSTVTKVQDSPF